MAEKLYSPSELKILFEAMNIAPAYLSRKFIFKRLCGWTEDQCSENIQFRVDEDQFGKNGNKYNGWR
jgi:hypothetical protein